MKYTDVADCVLPPSMIREMAKMMEAVRTSETSVFFNKTTQRCVPEGYYVLILAAMKTRNVARW
jgi:hypothetical protein